MKCRWCKEIVPKDVHTCPRAPSNKCFNCGSTEHMRWECTQGKCCYKCGSKTHIARECQGQVEEIVTAGEVPASGSVSDMGNEPALHSTPKDAEPNEWGHELRHWRWQRYHWQDSRDNYSKCTAHRRLKLQRTEHSWGWWAADQCQAIDPGWTVDPGSSGEAGWVQCWRERTDGHCACACRLMQLSSKWSWWAWETLHTLRGIAKHSFQCMPQCQHGSRRSDSEKRSTECQHKYPDQRL